MKRRKKDSARQERVSTSPAAQKLRHPPARKLPSTELRRKEFSARKSPRSSGDGEKAKTARSEGATAPDVLHPEHKTLPDQLPAAGEAGAAESAKEATFPIIGIGASAGGLAAFEALFAH